MLDLIFPPRCICCTTFVDKFGMLCSSCFKKIDFISRPYCDNCGAILRNVFAINDALCDVCIGDQPYFDKCRALFVYNEESRPIIARLKFFDQQHLAKILANMMISKLRDMQIDKSAIIIPVPLHIRRLLKRKYNQSLLLAKELAKADERMLLADGLIRTKPTLQQAGLSRRQREVNVKNAFAVNPKYKKNIAKCDIILIDDVRTTSSTVDSCCKALRKISSRNKIFVLTVGHREQA